MNFNIDLTIYFEIKDSHVFGGLGTVGYSHLAMKNIGRISYESDNLFNKAELMEEFIASQAKDMAVFCKVPVECVRAISKEEYDANTEEDDGE